MNADVILVILEGLKEFVRVVQNIASNEKVARMLIVGFKECI